MPDQRAYDETELGIVLAPEHVVGSEDEAAFGRFKAAVEEDFRKAAAKGGCV